jgi:GNAT superfamily N-acetyltransferase
MTVRSHVSDAPSLLRRAVGVARSEGPAGVLRRLRAYRKEKFGLAHSILLTQPICLDDAPPRVPAGLVVERLDPADGAALHALEAAYGTPATVEGFLSRLAQQEICYLARLNGRIVGYLWVCYGDRVTEYGRTLFRMALNEIYYHNVYVVPEQRGQNICPYLTAIAGAELAREMGKTEAVLFIRWNNYSSLNASRKMGAMKVGRIGYLRLFGRKLHFLFRHRPLGW